MDYRTWNPTLCDLPTASFSNLISFHSPSCPLHPNHSDLFHEHIKLIYASEPLCLLLHLSGVLSLLCMIQNSGQISTFPRDCLKTNLSKIPPGPIPTPSILCCITLFCFLPKRFLANICVIIVNIIIILRRRKWQPTPVFLPGEPHGWRSPRGRKESDTTEWLHFKLTHIIILHFRVTLQRSQTSVELTPG